MSYRYFEMKKSEADYFEMNRVGWDRRTAVHFESRFYDVDGFLAGNSSLRETELSEMEDVRGKKLLHLQCHFGLDTLSWARQGAICTGVDISPVAIQKAQELARKADLSARFVCSDVYGLAGSENEPFDIVFTSYGALCWLPDLTRWAEVVAANLAIGGRFYIVEFHPIHDLLTGFPYFTRSVPDIDEEGTYTENGAKAVAELATWSHPISSVINALVRVGIRVERFNEYPFSPYDCFEGMEEPEPGRFYLSHKGNDIPIVYSIVGTRVA
ncbi:class I SAM-dependent methyltransferase [Nitrogeniibacter aestuarii]|uniref:class I SAM-dependent methyltransferase n=1 Tax=Nitrogeniibacter aestuarii TaxID=2815343 RepID=UPI001E29DB5D|nr:class I SAM-dependent methyltransferase [Nitrogeniibacter aestuarii]